MVTPEIAPFVKVGGLADVVGALPKALKLLGHDVRVLCPLYGGIWRGPEWRAHDGCVIVHMGGSERYGRIWETRIPQSDVPAYFIEYRDYFDRHEVYTGPWGGHKDNPERYTFLSHAGFDLCHHLHWYPDVIHAHDWPTALIPVMLTTNQNHGSFANTASVLTIHNLEHQGVFDRYVMQMANLPDSVFRSDGLESLGHVNMLKGGIYHANKVTTVSPSYAREIQGDVGGCGIHDVLRFKSGDLVGILNGIDSEVWNPETDNLIPAKYSVDDLSGKAKCKEELQRRFDLHIDPTIPVFGVVSRLVRQKGLDILRDIIGSVVNNMRVQFVVLGAGDEDLQWDFGGMPRYFSGRIGAYVGFHNDLAHLIEAGSDFFVMPSRFEPCGLNQMYSMVYGTPPIVRAIGGLADSVEQYVEGQNQGTGFLFNDPSAHALYYTIGWACSTYYDRPQEYRAMQIRGMKRDFSWKTSAQKYLDVYTWALEKKGRYLSPVEKSFTVRHAEIPQFHEKTDPLLQPVF